MLPPALSVAQTGPTVMETVSGVTANVQIIEDNREHT